VRDKSHQPSGEYEGSIIVKPANSYQTELKVKLHVWNITLPNRIQYPTCVWTTQHNLSPHEYRNLLALFLEHHIDPISVGNDFNFNLLDENMEFCLKKGLMVFETPKIEDLHKFNEYYKHIKEKGWLDKAMVYSPKDEPTEETFRNIIIPHTTIGHKKFPCLKTFLATQYYNNLDKGTDIWLYDVSTNFKSWIKSGCPGKQENWWYFCALPINVSMERPLADAPLMLIDRDAIEQRIVYWMAYYYKIKGIFIYAGNIAGWPNEVYELTNSKMPYPYAGITNGNGFLAYPPSKSSIRLKIIRDGIEDYWYIKKVADLAASGFHRKEAQNLIADIVLAIFVNTHYFNNDPESLLTYRKKFGEFLNGKIAY